MFWNCKIYVGKEFKGWSLSASGEDCIFFFPTVRNVVDTAGLYGNLPSLLFIWKKSTNMYVTSGSAFETIPTEGEA